MHLNCEQSVADTWSSPTTSPRRRSSLRVRALVRVSLPPSTTAHLVLQLVPRRFLLRPYPKTGRRAAPSPDPRPGSRSARAPLFLVRTSSATAVDSNNNHHHPVICSFLEHTTDPMVVQTFAPTGLCNSSIMSPALLQQHCGTTHLKHRPGRHTRLHQPFSSKG